MSRGFWGCIVLNITWLCFVVFYVWWSNHSFLNLKPAEFGGFLAGVTAPLALVWIIWGFLFRKKELSSEKKQKKKERLRKAMPNFEDVSAKNIFTGGEDDGHVKIPNRGGTANAIKIDENEFISTEMKRVSPTGRDFFYGYSHSLSRSPRSKQANRSPGVRRVTFAPHIRRIYSHWSG